jgi:hypothetical protein
MHRRLLPFLAIAQLLLAVAPQARALVLDWDVVNWTAGTLSNSYDIDPASPGNDVTISLSGNTAALRVDPASGSLTPVDNTSLHGGLSPAQQSLLFTTAFDNSTQSITITVTFSPQYAAGVTDVSFTLFGIQKRSNIQDFVSSISALGIDGTTLYAPTITNVGSSVLLSGSGLNQTLTGSNSVPATGTGSGAGNATISFSTPGIQSFQFTFSNATGAPNPGTQNVSLHDINFTPVPEVNPAAVAAAVCVAAIAALRRIRRRHALK